MLKLFQKFEGRGTPRTVRQRLHYGSDEGSAILLASRTVYYACITKYLHHCNFVLTLHLFHSRFISTFIYHPVQKQNLAPTIGPYPSKWKPQTREVPVPVFCLEPFKKQTVWKAHQHSYAQRGTLLASWLRCHGLPNSYT